MGYSSLRKEVAMDFNSILIGSEDPARLVVYYTRLLGEPRMSDGTYTGWVIGRGFVAIGPHSEVTGPNVHPGRIIWNIESDDVQADFDRFKAAGAIVVAEPYAFSPDGPTAIATFADPDGNYFQLMSPMAP
jgi:predicted enzyme related to lactoylglutathione lyase